MRNLKNIKIGEDIHKLVKVYCAQNDLVIIDWIEQIIKKELENANTDGKD